MSKPIQIFSEIEPLKRVMLHRPGAELENFDAGLFRRLVV